jgi:hypothetical protein
MTNKISIIIPPTVEKTVFDALDAIDAALAPYLQALTDEERSNMLKLSDKSVAFVTKANEYGNGKFKNVSEPFVDLAEFKKDSDATIFFNKLNNRLGTLKRSAEDTGMIAGSESMEAALLVYAAVKMAVRNNTPGAQDAYNEMAVRFLKRKNKNPEKP